MVSNWVECICQLPHIEHETHPFLSCFFEIVYWDAVNELEKLGKWRLLLKITIKTIEKLCFNLQKSLLCCFCSFICNSTLILHRNNAWMFEYRVHKWEVWNQFRKGHKPSFKATLNPGMRHIWFWHKDAWYKFIFEMHKFLCFIFWLESRS